MFLFPYIEASSVYDALDDGNFFGKCKTASGDDTTIPAAHGNTGGITSDTLKAAMAIPAYTGPASRASSPKYTLGLGYQLGAKTDYVVLNAKDDFTAAWERYYCYYDELASDPRRWQKAFVSPFKIPTLTMNNNGYRNYLNHGKRITDWTYEKGFGWWKDGTSNQLCLGEKHIPEKYRNDEGGPQVCWDGSYGGVYNNEGGGIMARIVSDNANLFAASPSTEPVSSSPVATGGTPIREGCEQLGSSHPGIVNFLVGDGSVHTFSTTMLPRLATHLTIVNDGEPVSLP
jgi:hypothetical protein